MSLAKAGSKDWKLENVILALRSPILNIGCITRQKQSKYCLSVGNICLYVSGIWTEFCLELVDDHKPCPLEQAWYTFGKVNLRVLVESNDHLIWIDKNQKA